MNFRVTSIAISWMLIAVAVTQVPENSKLSSFSRLRPAELKAEVWKLPKPEREGLIREYKASITPAISAEAARARLVSLGDRNAAQETVKEMVEDGSHFHRNLGYSGSPYVVHALSQYLFKDEPYSVKGTDVGIFPVSFTAAIITIQVLSDSSAFNGEVISWARRHQYSDPVALRKELRRWWKENEGFFEKEEFLSVKPGMDISAAKPTVPEPTMHVAAPQSTLSEPTLKSQKDDRPEDSQIVLYIAGGILALLLAALFFMARGRRGTAK